MCRIGKVGEAPRDMVEVGEEAEGGRQSEGSSGREQDFDDEGAVRTGKEAVAV